jgi:hypothetical protein
MTWAGNGAEDEVLASASTSAKIEAPCLVGKDVMAHMATRKKVKNSPASGVMPMRQFDDVMKALMKVPPKHRSSKPKGKKKPG